MRIMIAGGGTGGHVYPGVAIYRALEKRGEEVKVRFVGSRGGVEEKIFLRLGLPYILLPGRGVRGAGLRSMVVFPFLFLAALWRAVREVKGFEPDVVVGTGGYASAAVVLSAVLCGKPRVLQEQNSVPGLANRLLSRFSHLVLLSYEESRPFFPRRVACAVIGNPLRFQGRKDRSSGARFLKLREELPTVLVFGGSRGARSLNSSSIEAVRRILGRAKVQFVILAGERDFEWVKRELEGEAESVRVLSYLEDMDLVYGAADLAVARAGASSVFELASYGIPTVFVPYPYAADEHQKRNVLPLEKIGAALIIEDGELSGEALEHRILALLGDEGKRREMAEKLKLWARADAAGEAAERIVCLVRKDATGPCETPGGGREGSEACGVNLR